MGFTWQTPPTFVMDEEPLTSAKLNYIRDDLRYLYGIRAVRAYHSAVQSIANNAWSVIGFDTARYDVDGMHDPVSYFGITITQVGIYVVGAWGEFAANATGTRGMRIKVNGTTVIDKMEVPNLGAAKNTPVRAGSDWQWTSVSGAYFQVEVFQDSGAALNFAAIPEVWAHWVGNP